MPPLSGTMNSVDYSRERFMLLSEGVVKKPCKVLWTWIYRELSSTGTPFWYRSYPQGRRRCAYLHELWSGSRALEVAFPRPETMFGDVAVAVNQKTHATRTWLVKENVILPIANKWFQSLGMNTQTLSLVLLMVKITLRSNDFLIWSQHNLPQVNVMNDDGTMNDLAFRICR